MFGMSLVYFMFLLPYNKVLLQQEIVVQYPCGWGDEVLPCLHDTSVCCNAIVLLFLCKYLNKKHHLTSVY